MKLQMGLAPVETQHKRLVYDGNIKLFSLVLASIQKAFSFLGFIDRYVHFVFIGCLLGNRLGVACVFALNTERERYC